MLLGVKVILLNSLMLHAFLFVSDQLIVYIYCIVNMDRTAHKGKITTQKTMWYLWAGITV